VINLPWS